MIVTCRNKRRRYPILLLVTAILLQFGSTIIRAHPRRPTDSITDTLRRGEELRRKWNIDDAEAAFLEAATLKPSSLDAALGLARVARAKIEYARALRLLDKAAGEHANSPSLLCEYGAIYLAAEEPRRARRVFETALRVTSSNLTAVIGLAEADLLERDYKSAIGRLQGCLERDPGNSFARSMLARALLENNKLSEAGEEAQRAIALDAYNVEALHVLALVTAADHKPDESRALARRVVSLDPYNFNARRMLSQYLDGSVGYEQKVSESGRIHLARGRAFKEEGELTRAAAELEAALRIEPRYYRALIALAEIWLRQGNLERAAATAQLATQVDPEGSIAHLELSSAHRAMNERARIEIGAVDFGALFNRGPSPAAYARTREIFPGYRYLTKQQQKVIDAAVAPLAMYLPRLASRKARHYLLAYDQRPGDLYGFADVVGEKTFDGRYYSSIRGVGGHVTVSGIEHIDQAANGGFNTIAHEFAHQVHIAALGKRELKEIRRLYEKARREGLALDYYAASNEDEYFAQGYEAFVSHRKRPSAGVTGRHTHQELSIRDPELYNFLVNLTGNRTGKIGIDGY